MVPWSLFFHRFLVLNHVLSSLEGQLIFSGRGGLVYDGLKVNFFIFFFYEEFILILVIPQVSQRK